MGVSTVVASAPKTTAVFRRIAVPTPKQLQALVERIAERIGRALERKGLLARDCDNSFLTLDAEAGGPMHDLLGHSITYRVAMGPRTGQKVFTLQIVPAPPPQEQKIRRRASGRLLAARRHFDRGARAQQA